MGGHMWVESYLGEGSTFYFTANFHLAPNADAKVAPNKEPVVALEQSNGLHVEQGIAPATADTRLEEEQNFDLEQLPVRHGRSIHRIEPAQENIGGAREGLSHTAHVAENEASGSLQGGVDDGEWQTVFRAQQRAGELARTMDPLRRRSVSADNRLRVKVGIARLPSIRRSTSLQPPKNGLRRLGSEGVGSRAPSAAQPYTSGIGSRGSTHSLDSRDLRIEMPAGSSVQDQDTCTSIPRKAQEKLVVNVKRQGQVSPLLAAQQASSSDKELARSPVELGHEASSTGTQNMQRISEEGACEASASGAENASLSMESDHVETSPKPAQGLQILLADDSLVNQKVACRYLEKKGLRADAVGDGAQVMRKLAEQPGFYDLLLLDVQVGLRPPCTCTSLDHCTLGVSDIDLP